MAKIGIMLEGQEDLTWAKWARLARLIDDLGFESLFRSDHLTALDGDSTRASLDLWPSLTALALQTSRLRFGPMVCSMTFRQPALLAKTAAAVDQLSGGRLELGLGAGWYKGEHRMFGVPYPPFQTRLDLLEEGVQVIKALWGGRPAAFAGRHYRLEAAQTHPGPAQSPLPIILGGKNEQRTLRLVAQYADEWNCTYIGVAEFDRKSRVLDDHCRALGRDPATLRRSLMTPFVVGRDEASLRAQLAAHQRMFAYLPGNLADWRAAGYIGGSPAEVVDQLKAFESIGVGRMLLQQNDFDDLSALELLAAEVLPHFS